MAHANDEPLMLTAIVGLAFAVLLAEIQSQSISETFHRTARCAGSADQDDPAFRRRGHLLAEAKFTPIFFLIVLTGYVFGGRFGFLMGVLMLGGLVTRSLGTVGLDAVPNVDRRVDGASVRSVVPLRTHSRGRALGEVIVPAVFGGVWGLLYGAIMKIWFWPFVSGSADRRSRSRVSLIDTLRRYDVFDMRPH